MVAFSNKNNNWKHYLTSEKSLLHGTKRCLELYEVSQKIHPNVFENVCANEITCQKIKTKKTSNYQIEISCLKTASLILQQHNFIKLLFSLTYYSVHVSKSVEFDFIRFPLLSLYKLRNFRQLFFHAIVSICQEQKGSLTNQQVGLFMVNFSEYAAAHLSAPL